MKPKLKPRNPLVAAAKFRLAGVHEKSGKAQRRQQKQALRQAVKKGQEVFPEHGHKRIPVEFVSAHALAGWATVGANLFAQATSAHLRPCR